MASGFASPYYAFKGGAIARRDLDAALLDRPAGQGPDADARRRRPRARCPMPGLAAIREVFQAARAQGFGQEDIAAVVKALEARRGARIRDAHGRAATDLGVAPSAVRRTCRAHGAGRSVWWSLLAAVIGAGRLGPGAPGPDRRRRLQAAGGRSRAAWASSRPSCRPAAARAGGAAPGRAARRARPRCRSSPRRRRGIRGELGQAHKALAEVKALEQGRAAADGPGRGQPASGWRRWSPARPPAARRARTSWPARSAQLPPDLLELNVAFGSKVVEYALRLPGGRYLPIDSKWTSAAPLERLAAWTTRPSAGGSRAGRRATCAAACARWRKYLDPERTLRPGPAGRARRGLRARRRRCTARAIARACWSCPYSLALPYVLALYRLDRPLRRAVDTEQLAGPPAQPRRVACAGRTRRWRAGSRAGSCRCENARDALRDHVLARGRRAGAAGAAASRRGRSACGRPFARRAGGAVGELDRRRPPPSADGANCS